jgi:GT2 family glycosyltransferase
MKCSVVILNWNGEQMLRCYLPSVLEHTQLPDVEIVVADNGSTDGSLAFLQSQPVRVIVLGQNYGFAEGYNRAIEQIDAEYVVLLNSDVEVSPNWLDTMLTYMDEHAQTYAVQPKVLSWTSKQEFDAGKTSSITFEHAGAAGGMIDILGYPYCRGRFISYVHQDQGQYDTISPIFWATGACLLVRTSTYKELGGLDTQFFAHQEEIDLCWRIHNAAYEKDPLNTHAIMALPQSVVYHLGGGTLGYESPRKTFLNFRNNLLMLYKNLPSSYWWVMLVRFFMDYVAALQMLLMGKMDNVKAIFQARRAYHKMRSTIYSNAIKPRHIPNIVARRSIIWDYYVMRKKQ